MQNNIKIIIVDDNPVFLEGLVTLMSKSIHYEVLATFYSGISFLENIHFYDPDLILIDIEMPWKSGMDVARIISNYITDPKLIAVSLYHDEPYIKKLKEAGFRGFVSKNKVADELDRVIETVMRGDHAFPPV
jgi:DNA-binding NarL/FixJ family response regulator